MTSFKMSVEISRNRALILSYCYRLRGQMLQSFPWSPHRFGNDRKKIRKISPYFEYHLCELIGSEGPGHDRVQYDCFEAPHSFNLVHAIIASLWIGTIFRMADEIWQNLALLRVLMLSSCCRWRSWSSRSSVWTPRRGIKPLSGSMRLSLLWESAPSCFWSPSWPSAGEWLMWRRGWMGSRRSGTSACGCVVGNRMGFVWDPDGQVRTMPSRNRFY